MNFLNFLRWKSKSWKTTVWDSNNSNKTGMEFALSRDLFHVFRYFRRRSRVPKFLSCIWASSRVPSPRNYGEDCVTWTRASSRRSQLDAIASAWLPSILTAVKRKIYLEVLVEDHYLLTVRLINIYYFTENVGYIAKDSFVCWVLSSHLA